jgi:flagellin
MASNTNAASKSMEKLSSGLRINRAGDDAAGLSISEKMRAQIKGLDQASRNSQDGVSMIQTGEGALNETHNILQRMRELSVQASTDTNVTADRTAIAEEVDSLQKEITRIAEQTQFNTQALFSGGSTVTLQVGANCGQTISITFSSMNATSLTVNAMSVSMSTQAGATAAISTINNAIEAVSKERSKLGAVQNRLEHTIANVNNASENLQAAESRVRDVDMAKEMMAYSKNNILQQAAQSMLAQANQTPQGVLQLLQ